MRTVVAGPRPVELEELIKRRHRLGQDRYDEIWNGDYHMSSSPHPFHSRVDTELTRRLGPYADRAGLIGITTFNLGEPDDYRIPDQGYHRVLPTTTWVPTGASSLLGLSAEELAAQIDWPGPLPA